MRGYRRKRKGGLSFFLVLALWLGYAQLHGRGDFLGAVNGFIQPTPAAAVAQQGSLEKELQPTLERIARGDHFPHRNDGSVFHNREGMLPRRVDGYYREYVHPTLGMEGAGVSRVILGQGGEIYYSPDHYQSFITVQRQ